MGFVPLHIFGPVDLVIMCAVLHHLAPSFTVLNAEYDKVINHIIDCIVTTIMTIASIACCHRKQ